MFVTCLWLHCRHFDIKHGTKLCKSWCREVEIVSDVVVLIALKGFALRICETPMDTGDSNSFKDSG